VDFYCAVILFLAYVMIIFIIVPSLKKDISIKWHNQKSIYNINGGYFDEGQVFQGLPDRSCIIFYRLFFKERKDA